MSGQPDLDKLVAELRAAGPAVRDQVKKSVSKGALNIKNQLRDEAKSTGHYRHFSRSIGYSKYDGGLSAEIGPDKDKRQGALGNILYFGTSKNAPELADPIKALDREAPKFEDAVADIGEDAAMGVRNA